MRYDHVLESFYNHPHAITEEKLLEIQTFLHAKVSGDVIADDRIRAIVAGRRDDGVEMVGRVAVVPVFGVIAQRLGLLGQASGGVSAEALGAKLDSLVNDKTVRAIVLAFDSPGGSVYGVAELGNKIHGYKGQKKVIGIADSVAASAAYWLLSQCQEINVTPGGQVGSIGVIAAHEDLSKRNEAKGKTTTLVTAGKFKAEGSPFGPLDEEARAEMQGKVDHYYAMFTQAVARGRGVTEAKVKADYGQGRMLVAKEAVARGMADHVATLAQVLGRLGADVSQGGVSPGMAMARARAIEVE